MFWKNETLSAHKGMDKTQIHHISIYKIIHLNHKYINRMLILKLHKKNNINFRIPSNMVIWFSQPQPPPPQLQDTDLGIMMDCESSSTRGYSSQGQFLRASRDQTVRGVFQENASRFTGMEKNDLGFCCDFFVGKWIVGSSKLSLRVQYVLFW